MKRYAIPLLPLFLLLGASCKKEAPPPPPPPVTAPPTTAPAPASVVSVTLGNAIGPDKRVAAATDTFGAKDIIYATVETEGTGHVKLRALWSFVKGEKTAKVDESVIEFDSAAPAVNEFHISKPSGWPKGDYKVEVFLGEAPTPAVTKTFKVS